MQPQKFHSPAVNDHIESISQHISDPALERLFRQCYPNTLDTTVAFQMVDGLPDTFVITGDIHAMWLRDSAAQVWPYLAQMQEDSELADMIAGLIRRHSACILIDPYANAFNNGPAHSQWQSDNTTMLPELHERKWELDSLCYAIRLAHGFWQRSSDRRPFDGQWLAAMKLAVATMKAQQRKKNRGPYSFTRNGSWQADTLACHGWGNPARPVGLIASMFRPSDDATVLPFLVPSNFFAVISLRQLASMVVDLSNESAFAIECTALADEVAAALQAHAIVQHPKHGAIYAYEVDGYGSALLMDDANIPSLLSLPYLGAVAQNEEVYQNTRRFALSFDNPWFFKGDHFEGNGSPHTLAPMIWPMSIIMRAMTSDQDDEISLCLHMLKSSHAETYFMHESFNANQPEQFTRSWFAWANTLLGELISKIAQERPHLLSAKE
ncbi:glycoside hydrolase family 125 protein [Janthinobacterium sp. B9-8]|uniref:glycoside hydrolase family 125 protein n=1 Tax=Janthinobacterium sp. B9-8 TaxID=1236179 RepID=UPI0006998B12|nr:glycoside hydrolase family 125 protein [Janthinobacterium sp. B9-8]AMC34506.1 Tat pathway signal protein [Janthinobacterium sp. B9-8]